MPRRERGPVSAPRASPGGGAVAGAGRGGCGAINAVTQKGCGFPPGALSHCVTLSESARGSLGSGSVARRTGWPRAWGEARHQPAGPRGKPETFLISSRCSDGHPAISTSPDRARSEQSLAAPAGKRALPSPRQCVPLLGHPQCVITCSKSPLQSRKGALGSHIWKCHEKCVRSSVSWQCR